MAKRIFPIIKYRFHAVAISSVLLLAGVLGFILLGGFNLGIDFQSGFSQRVQIAPAALSVAYSGTNSVSLDVSGGTVTLLVRDGSGARYYNYNATEYPTAGAVAAAINSQVAGVTAIAVNPSLPTVEFITGFGLPATLSANPVVLNSANTNTSQFVSIDDMREALGLGAQVQVVGDPHRQIFQLRLGNDDNQTEDQLSSFVAGKLSDSFGEASIVTLQSDFVGPKYSSTLVSGSILIVIVSIGLILLYIWFRFKISYALAAIITLVHDSLLLVGFIVVFQLEVSSTTIAALLTIIGYSLNNVIVIFDRIRENRPILKDLSMMQLIDTSVSQSLSRTIFSSLTTILAISPLAILASGAIQLFAIEMVFGILVGAYSCNFLAPALLLWISKKKEDGKKQVSQNSTPAMALSNGENTSKPVVKDVVIPTAERKLKGKRQQK